MLPDDIFLARLETTITALRYWAPSIADAAKLDQTETGDYWRIVVKPAMASACPFALTLHKDQRYDLKIAGEAYDGRPVETFDWFIPLADAVADGNVVQRRRISRLTGLEHSVETLVMLANGGIWRETRGNDYRMPTLDDDGTELRERRFLPYRR